MLLPMRRLALLVPLLLGTAHAASLTLAPGQTGRLGSATVTLLRVQDSRCPINARCIQAGELAASVLVRRGGQSQVLKLRLPEPANAPWLGLRLEDATPLIAGQRVPLRLTFSDGRP